MAVKSKNPKIAIQNPQLRQYVSGQVTVPQMKATATIIPAGSLVEYTSGEIKLNTEQSAATFGLIRNACASAGMQDVEFGFVPVKMGSPVERGFKIAPRANGYAGKYQVAQDTILTPVTGDAFTNQPNNDGVEVLSSSTADVGITVTLYGNKHGALTTEYIDAITLNGTNAVSSTYTDWSAIHGVRLSGACAGTITIREASGNLAITTIAAGSLTSGIHAADSEQAYGLVPRRDGSAASTAYVTIGGLGLDGVYVTSCGIMDGTTEGDLGTTPFGTVTEVMLGGVAADCDVTIKSNEAADTSVCVGIALDTTTVPGVVVDCWIKPYWM